MVTHTHNFENSEPSNVQAEREVLHRGHKRQKLNHGKDSADHVFVEGQPAVAGAHCASYQNDGAALDIQAEKLHSLSSGQLAKVTFQDAEQAPTGPVQHNPDTLICYGMLYDIQTSCETFGDFLDEKSKLAWDGSRYLQEISTGHDVVALSLRVCQMLFTLIKVAKLDLQFRLAKSAMPVSSDDQFTARTKTDPLAYNLSIILYGPADIADATGEWLSKLKMYLQLPSNCDRNVQYINPQCLTSEDDPPMTNEIMSLLPNSSDSDDLTQSATLFEDLYTDVFYEEHVQPPEVKSILRSHQKQALTFMLQRERGWCYDNINDLWERETDLHHIVRYRNRLSGKSQAHPPKPFYGGILADEMGLGKTCSMLSLIVANKAVDTSMSGASFTAVVSVKATLVVVPFSLVGVWEKQIRDHLLSDNVRTCIYHGQAAQMQNPSFNNYDIVITTYNTVAHRWKDVKGLRQKQGGSHIFNVKWHRVVLDEAHIIRTRRTMIAKAVCSISSDYRWCITGTPIQNRLSDLYNLLHFLRIEPYDDFRVFDEEILRPLKYGKDDTIRKIQALLKAVGIRRSKRFIKLDSASKHTEIVSLSEAERLHYDKVRDRVLEIIDSAIKEQRSSGSTYMNAFQRINDLRYICNHGTRSKRTLLKSTIRTKIDVPTFTAQLDNLLLGSGDLCINCGTDIREEEEDNSGRLDVSKFSQTAIDGSQLCCACLREERANSASPTPSDRSDLSDSEPCQLSSKIQSLIARLKDVPIGEKAAVFSYWTSTLDSIGAALSAAGIQFSYFHGALSNLQRIRTLNEFSSSPELQVILVSITCGGQGLDLTCANHAFLVEPQWNPMLEEQAMSRVHRIGQTKPVHLVRFIVQGTWEEKIRILQESKRSLAGLVVDRQILKDGDDGKKQLYLLQELVR